MDHEYKKKFGNFGPRLPRATSAKTYAASTHVVAREGAICSKNRNVAF